MNFPVFIDAALASGKCSYVELRDKLDLNEAANMIEHAIVRAENERRAHEAAERKAKSKKKR